jgi:hypothetical protein
VFELTFAEKVRIDMLKKYIMTELNMQDKFVKADSNAAKLRKKEVQKARQKEEPESFLQEMAEIVSFSEKPG